MRPSRAETIARFSRRRPAYWGVLPPHCLSRFSPSTGAQGPRELVLTFDACGGSRLEVDESLLATLRRHRVKATLFLNEHWILRHRRLTRELIADPLFEVENHGSRHVPLSVTGRAAYGIPGTASAGEVWEEVTRTTELLRSFGADSRFMRPGTAHADDVAAEIAVSLGQRVASFSVNADGGATFPPAVVAQTLLSAPTGSITIAHMNQPRGGTSAGVARALPRLLDSGVVFRHLHEVATSP